MKIKELVIYASTLEEFKDFQIELERLFRILVEITKRFPANDKGRHSIFANLKCTEEYAS